MVIKRQILKKIEREIDSKEFISIVGPRQAGKTTLLGVLRNKILARDSVEEDQLVSVTFQDYILLDEFNSNPVKFIEDRKHENKKTYFFLDEFQLIDKAGQKLKLIYDTVENIKIFITGSSSLEIREVGSQMVGRLFEYNLNTFSLNEVISQEDNLIKNNFERYQQLLEDFIFSEGIQNDTLLKDPVSNEFENRIKEIVGQIIKYGTYPAVYLSQHDDSKITRLSNIYGTYVEKDILNLLKIGKTQKFLKLVKYLALSIGNLFVNSNVQRDLGLYYEEIDTFMDALEQTFVVKQVRPFFTNKNKELKKLSFYYFNDLGIRNWAIQNFNSIDSRTDNGFLIENYILRRLIDLRNESGRRFEINYWRKASGAEVDFVIDNAQELIPIEVKYQNFDKPEFTKSFYSFLDEYSPKKAIIVTKNFFGQEERNGTNIIFVPYYLF